jgi:preprotein translocase subunit SecF
MLYLIRPNTHYDFLGKASFFGKLSAGLVIVSLFVIFGKGLNFGLDFTGGHEILLEFEKKVSPESVRSALEGLDLGDTSVQTFEVPDSPKAFYLVRIERSSTFGTEEIGGLETAFRTKYGDALKQLEYNPEAGDVIEVSFVEGATKTADLSTATLAKVVEATDHPVRTVRQSSRTDFPEFAIVLRGVDVSVVNAVKPLDPSAKAAKVEFVGPTVGKQLRNDGVLAVLYALLCILVYVAFRFDFVYAPGAVLCLFHDAIITVAFLALIGEEFSLASIAGILTLVGYSINDTIVVFDRIRETVGKSQGKALVEVINRAVNETLGRTILTSGTTLLACIALMVFGRGTVLASFGLLMTVGLVVGTYSTVFVASPIFVAFRRRYGPKTVATERGGDPLAKGSTAASAP